MPSSWSVSRTSWDLVMLSVQAQAACSLYLVPCNKCCTTLFYFIFLYFPLTQTHVSRLALLQTQFCFSNTSKTQFQSFSLLWHGFSKQCVWRRIRLSAYIWQPTCFQGGTSKVTHLVLLLILLYLTSLQGVTHSGCPEFVPSK